MGTIPFINVAPAPNNSSGAIASDSPGNATENCFAPVLRDAINNDNSENNVPSESLSTENTAVAIAPLPASESNPQVINFQEVTVSSSPSLTSLQTSLVSGQQQFNSVSTAILQEQGTANLLNTGTNTDTNTGTNSATKTSINSEINITLNTNTESSLIVQDGTPQVNRSTSASNTVHAALLASPTSEVSLAPSNTNLIGKPADSLITDQLQEILDRAGIRENVIIRSSSIHNSNRATEQLLFQEYGVRGQFVEETILAANNNLGASIRAEISVAGNETPGNRLETVRQNFADQYLNARLETSSDDEGQQANNQQNTGQENKFSQQQVLLPSQINSSVTLAEHAGSAAFSDTLAIMSSNGQTITGSSQSGQLNFVPIVPEHELVTHLVERFSTNPRLQTSRITMQLNPAELGALKIDILVQGDSIKAHIGVQSQQVQELIDKNMSKLRSVLEEQGFNIEDFQITLNSDTGDQFDFFQEHYQSNQNLTAHSDNQGSGDGFDFSLESATIGIGTESVPETSDGPGINLTV